MGGDVDRAPQHDPLARPLDQQQAEPVRVVRRGEQRHALEPADERLRVADACPDVDDPGQARLVQALPGRRQLRDAGDPAAPVRCRRRVEADVVDHRRRRVGVRLQLSAGPKRVHQHLPAVGGDVELGQVDVPGALRRPADELPGAHPVAALDARVDVPVAEVADADAAADAGRARGLDHAALDREDAVRPAGGSALLGPVVPDGDVDAGVVDGAERRVGPRVEERAADRMLLVLGRHRPAAEVVVVALWERRHLGDRSLTRPAAAGRSAAGHREG